jgi:hypothetical protein
MKFTPKEMFVRVSSVQDIQGIDFAGVIQCTDWHLGDSGMRDAFHELKNSQPELFAIAKQTSGKPHKT